jgi:hypothetical protein
MEEFSCWRWWLSSSGKWHRVALIRTDISEDCIASIFSSHSCTLKMEATRSSETSVLIRATRCHFPEDDNHHSHRRGNLKSFSCWSLSILLTRVHCTHTYRQPYWSKVLCKYVWISHWCVNSGSVLKMEPSEWWCNGLCHWWCNIVPIGIRV